MKAIVIEKYGSPQVLKCAHVAMAEPGPQQVLVEIHASSVNPVDWKIRKGKLKFITGMKFPRFLGGDLSGTIVKVGKKCKRFKEGDEVYGLIGAIKGGAYAEYIAIDEKALVLKPANLSFEEAAAIPLAGQTALQGLRDKGKMKKGQNILINGCTGGVGLFAVQIAKNFETTVTGVCSTESQSLAREIGCDFVIDYKKEDLNALGKTYELIFDAAGMMDLKTAKKLLTKNGIYVSTLPSLKLILKSIFSRLSGGKTYKSILLKSNAGDLNFLRELSEKGKLRVIIDSEFTLEDTVKAHEKSEQGHAKGKIIISVKK
jgi:NADPH:quinone reductase-like Zn-dependent oxidoreductase